MSLQRRILAGRCDGDANCASVRATQAAGDGLLWEQFRSSTVGRAGAQLINLATRAAADSTVVQTVRQARHTWDAWPPVMRLRGIGLMTLCAVATHLAMTASTLVPGLWRFLLPGLAGAFGVVVLGLSYLGPHATEERD